MKKNCLFLCFLLSTCSIGYSQTNGVDNMVPRTPEVKSLMQSGEFPIDYYTGTPSISIPIFTLTEQNFSLPLTLTYDGTAIRTADLPGWVGQNWNFLPGGCISRIVVGSVLDYTGDTTDYNTIIREKGDANSILVGSDTSTTYNTDFLNWEVYPWFPWPNTSGRANTNLNGIESPYMTEGDWFQPDIYQFDFLGYTGEFYINPSTGKITYLKKQDHIVFNDLRGSNLGWEAILPNGIQVYFSSLEQIQPLDLDNWTPSDTWKISSIVLVNGEQINFTYTPISYYQYMLSDNATYQYADSIDLVVNHNEFDDQTTPYDDYTLATGLSASEHNNLYLTRIESSHYVIKFDLSSDAKPKLTDIRFFDKYDSTTERKMTFSYADYKNAGDGWDTEVTGEPYYSGPSVYDRYKLTRLTPSCIYHGTETPDSSYGFQYIENIGLPSTFSRGQDYWGYFNGVTSNTCLMPDETRIFSFLNNYEISQVPSSILTILRTQSTAQRYVDTTYLSQGMLSMITYPTKGYSVFNYEPHTFHYAASHILTRQEQASGYSGVNDSASVGAGVRIKEIINYDLNGNFVSRKKYTYEYAPGATSGQLFVPLHFWNILALGGCTSVYHSWSNSGVNLNTSPLIPYSVGYDQVNIYESSTASDAAPGQTNGSTTYQFYNTPLAFNVGFNYPYLTTLDSRNGLKSIVSYYDNAGDLLRQENYHYKLLETNQYTSIKTLEIFVNGGCPIGDYQNEYELIFYPMIEQLWKQDTLSTTTYTTAGIGIKEQAITTYETDSFHLLFTKSALRSDGNNFNTALYLYPGDYTDVTGFIGDMKSRDIMDKPIETVSCLNLNGSISIIGGVLSTYKPAPQAGLKNLDYILATTGPIPLASFQFSNQSAAGILPAGSGPANSFNINSPLYQQRMNYLCYDLIQNPISYQKNSGMIDTYIWDYSNELPIARVMNADSAYVAYTSFEAGGTGGWTVGTGSIDTTAAITGSKNFSLNGTISKSGLNNRVTYVVSYWSESHSTPFSVSGSLSGYPTIGKTVNINGRSWTYFEYEISGQTTVSITGTGHIDELRLYPANAQMTTYTYIPLFGLSSQCDVDNRVTYYDYDGLGRLRDNRDQDGNIIKTYQYHYKQ